MQTASRPCKKQGCSNLATLNGYCLDHQIKTVDRFDNLNVSKEAWKKRFYSGRRWRNTSLSFRRAKPFCENCLPKKVVGELVHHQPSLEELIDAGLDPYDNRYLHTLCGDCHQRELSKKKQQNEAIDVMSIFKKGKL